MTFAKSDIEKKPEKKRRGRSPSGRYPKWKKNGPYKWVPSDEFIKMVRDTLVAEGFPVSRMRFSKRKRRVTLMWRCRSYDETHFVFRKFYTPHHVRQFLKIWFRWDDPERRPKNGRPKNPPKPPKDWSLDRRTKAWKSRLLHKQNPLLRRDEPAHGPRRSRKLLAR